MQLPDWDSTATQYRPWVTDLYTIAGGIGRPRGRGATWDEADDPTRSASTEPPPPNRQGPGIGLIGFQWGVTDGSRSQLGFPA